MNHVKSMVGLVFGRLVVIERAGSNRHGKVTWKCLCNCGVELVVVGTSLRSNVCRSCGCLRRELMILRSRTGLARKHGHARKNAHSKTYTAWSSMLQRCTNPNATNYRYYGGANPPIIVCRRWRTFKNFYLDMGKCPEGASLGRLKDTGDYKPGNAQWMTRAEQGVERRRRYATKIG